MTTCLCRSGRDLDACCGPLIAGAPAPTAEALMRARYTAFLTGGFDYLEATLGAEMRDQFDRVEVEASARDSRGMGFEVRQVAAGGEGDDAGEVEYVARFQVRDQPYVHHERASFRREDGRWLYVKGEVNPKGPPRYAAKVGRNDPCPCGSGKKFKKCCGA